MSWTFDFATAFIPEYKTRLVFVSLVVDLFLIMTNIIELWLHLHVVKMWQMNRKKEIDVINSHSCHRGEEAHNFSM